MASVCDESVSYYEAVTGVSIYCAFCGTPFAKVGIVLNVYFSSPPLPSRLQPCDRITGSCHLSSRRASLLSVVLLLLFCRCSAAAVPLPLPKLLSIVPDMSAALRSSYGKSGDYMFDVARVHWTVRGW